MTNLHQMSASKAAQAIRNGELKSEDLLRACIERITEKEPQTQAWVSTHFSAALEQARHLDRSAYSGILHGLPFGAKDLFDTYDFPTRYGSPIYQNNQPSTDAVHIALMRQAGGILLGKTVTTEFATFKGGPTTNPHNVTHTPGGSSSGSAAAVADYMVPLATGSQTAGSIIRPASFCGVVGYKPSFGKISLGGAKSLSPSLDTLGSFSRSVEDAALCVAAMTGDTALAQISSIDKPIRLATCLTPDAKVASQETLFAIEHARVIARDVFKTEISEAVLPSIFEKMSEAQGRIMWAESAKSFAFEQNNFPDQLSQQLKGLIKLGSNISYEQYSEDLKTAEVARRFLDEYLTHEVDILIAPSAIGKAPQGLTQTGDPIFCRIWTLMGVPCINLPLYTSIDGLPVGIQLIAARGKDALLLAVADHVLKAQENT
jgi:Asp-tRNA(Asn)/Glu-tRNA(Gln) amidotransferase A subunit family amidase